MKLLPVFLVYLVWSFLVSVLTFAFYGWDKRQAQLEGRRTSERTLHWLAWLGGWPGALVGQRVFRHKTRKKLFNLILWSAVVTHLLLLIVGGYWLAQWN